MGVALNYDATTRPDFIGVIYGAMPEVDIDIFDAVVSTFADTRLEPDVEELLWSVVNLFHRAGQREGGADAFQDVGRLRRNVLLHNPLD